MLTKIKFDNFTAFKKMEIPFSPGINLFIGENGTGKTHILKAAYAACEISKTQSGFANKLSGVFLPSGKHLGRLVKRAKVSKRGSVEVSREIEKDKTINLRAAFSNHTSTPDKAKISGSPTEWNNHALNAAYIPVKDMMANAPGFRSLYEEREIHFEEIYVDILRKANLPLLKGPTDKARKALLGSLQKSMSGKVVLKNEEFFLKNKYGELEFTLLAEGYRKLGLLWVLIQNGTLGDSSVLFWDEPETNLNPKIMRMVVGLLLELQRVGVQIFVTTHDYVILKEFDLQQKKADKLRFHSLYRNEEKENEVSHHASDNFLDIAPNAIDATFGDLVQRELRKSIGGSK